MTDIRTINTIKINPTFISNYQCWQGTSKKKQKQYKEPNKTAINQAKSKISKTSTLRLRNAIEWLTFITKDKRLKSKKYKAHNNYKLGFITLTLPSTQQHTDNEIKAICLNSFIEKLRYKYDLKFYVWRAEKQLNGNIHFHMIVNKFVYYKAVQKYWNDSCEKLGYVTRYSEKMKLFHKKGFAIDYTNISKWTIQQQEQAYKKGISTNWMQPNSTDIHAVIKAHNVVNYCTKYLCKDVARKYILQIVTARQNKKKRLLKYSEIKAIYRYVNYKLSITGRLWYISSALHKFNNITFNVTYGITDNLRDFWKHCKYRVKEFKYCSIIKVYIQDLKKWGLEYIAKLLDEQINIILNSIFLNQQLEKVSFSHPVGNGTQHIK